MDFSESPDQETMRAQVRELCAGFPDAYWRRLEAEQAYPEEFVRALTQSGWLGALIPAEYGGKGLGLSDAATILEEIQRSGGNASAAHAQMYVMGTVLRHGSEEQKRRYLPGVASGELRLQAFAVTEPDAGLETTRLSTFARKTGGGYVVNGNKVFISRVMQSDLMLLLARTTAYEDLEDKSRGLSVFLIDIRAAVARGQLVVEPLPVMFNNHTNRLTFNDLEVPAASLIGQEGEGFRYIIDSWNAERILIASESVGDGYWFTGRATQRSRDRVVFDRPIGANQAVQHPIAQAYAQVEAAALMRDKAAWLFDAGQRCGAEANMAKLLASQAAWAAANACMDTHGGYGFAKEYDVERKFRETRLYITAPVTNHMVLNFIGQNVLGMPRSY
ncbi:MAG TPA: acyl-CoA dehydrogenase family protein [Dehalococcoidia bacterium]|nr:acyl-CoA dehydrogenase family protein [Dehalococcoidia bacterium]